MESQREKAQALLDEAKASINNGDPINGVVKLTQCLMADATLAEAYLTRSALLLAMGDADGAADDARWLTDNTEANVTLTALKAKIAATYKELGRRKYAMGDTVGAEQDVRKALEMNPNCMETVSGKYTAEGVEQKVKRTFGMANAHKMAQNGTKGCHECEKSTE